MQRPSTWGFGVSCFLTSVNYLIVTEGESAEAAGESVQGSFLNLLPPRAPKRESPEQPGRSK
uniref:Uncharacterized protein n=1 Tax=Rhizophora mucronata TaxID=61149 RepID=A0A2P2JKH4_RHIMU